MISKKVVPNIRKGNLLQAAVEAAKIAKHLVENPPFFDNQEGKES